MSVITRKDLSVFRGTYAECKNSWEKYGVENMRVYLSWDTCEIFVGNAAGQAVPYGVPKILYNDIEKRMSEIKDSLVDVLGPVAKEKVEEITPALVEEKAGSLIAEEIAKALLNYYTKADVDVISDNVSSLESRVIAVESKKKLSDFENDQNYATEKYVQDTVNALGITPEQIDLLKDLVNSGIQSFAQKSYVDEKISEINDNISRFVEKDYVDNEISEINNRIDNISTNDCNIIYKSGTEMQSMTESKQLVFCTSSTTASPVYKANQLYYYDATKKKFVAIAGGGTSVKESKTSVFTLHANNWPTDSEISNEDITVSGIYADIDSIDAFDSDTVFVKLNNTAVSGKYTIITVDAKNSVNISDISLDKRIARTNTLQVGAVTKTNDDDFEYTVKNSVLSVKFYIPEIIEKNSEEVVRKEYLNNTNEIPCNAGDEIVYYTKTPVKTFKMGGFPYTEYTESVAAEKDINGVTVNIFYKYVFNIASLAPGATSVIIEHEEG